MAVIGQYERRVLPQGGIETPRGTEIGTAIGAGLQDLGQAGQRAVFDVERADQIMQQRSADAELAKMKPQALLDIDKINDDAEKAAPAGAPGHVEAVTKAYDEYAKTKLEGLSPLAREEAENWLNTAKVSIIGNASRFQKTSDLAKRGTDIVSASQLWQNKLASDPSLLPLAQTEMAKAIAGSGMDATNAEKYHGSVNQDLIASTMGGMASTRPGQLLQEIQAGKWNSANPADLVQYKGIATRQIAADQAEAERKQREAEAEAKANFGIVYDDAVSTAANTGVQKTVTDAQIDRHYTGAAAEVLKRKIHTAEAEGLARIQVGRTTRAEDNAWLAANAPTPGKEFTGDQAKVFKARADAIEDKRKSLAAEVTQDIKDSADEAQVTVGKNFDDYSQTAFTSGKVSEDAVSAISDAYSADPVKRKQMTDALQQSAELGNQARAVQTTSAAEDAGAAADLSAAAAAGGPGSADAQALLDARTKAIAAKQAAFAGSDPAGAALATSPAIADSFTQWQDASTAGDPAAPDYLRAAIAQGQAEQERQAVPPQNRKPLPESTATSIIGQINSLQQPKEKLAALMQYADLGGNAGQSVLAQLTSVKNGLPTGTDLVIDRARTDPVGAERIFSGLLTNTKGVEVGSEGKKAIVTQAQDGMLGVLAMQGEITGNPEATGGMAGNILNAAEQLAKARILLGTESEQAGRASIQDLMAPYAQIKDRSLAAVFYPADIEKAAPGAVEAGLVAERNRIAQDLKPLPSAPIVSEMKLTPQEQFLYQGHVNNITGKNGGKKYTQPDGKTSTVLQMIEPVNGKWYSIPSVWDGKPHTEDQAYDHAEKIGWEKFPSYATQDEGQARYDKMHAYMERDVDAKPNPYIDATVRSISSGAVWVNDGSGFSLVMPGSNRSLGFRTYAQARDSGLKAIQDGLQYPVNVARPQDLDADETPYFMKNPVPGAGAPGEGQ